MFDSNINQLVKLLVNKQEEWTVILFPLLYPLGFFFPFQLFYLHNVRFSWINLVWLYLGMWVLILIRISFRKLEFQAGLVISRLNDRKARIWGFLFDQLLVFVLASIFSGRLLDGLGLLFSLLVYELIFILPGYYWHYFNSHD